MTAPLVVILAGGEGRRIGGGKPLRTLGGERLVDRAVRFGRLWSDDVRLAVREAEQVQGGTVPLLLDDTALAGPLAGLASAVRAAEQAGRQFLLTIPCDVPFLPGDLSARLRDAIGDRLAALARSGDRLHPTCALWRTAAGARLPAYAASGKRSLVGFAEGTGFATSDWPADRFFNVNSEGNLAEAERRLRLEIQHSDGPPGFNPGPGG